MTTLNKTTWTRTSLVVLYSQNYAAEIRRHYHESSDCFEYPKKSLLKSSHPKKYLPNFPTQKNSRNRKFQTQKILRSSPSLEIQSTPPGVKDKVMTLDNYLSVAHYPKSTIESVMFTMPRKRNTGIFCYVFIYETLLCVICET